MSREQRIVITAGASGIGRAVAERFLANGAQVAICDVDDAALDDFRNANPDAVARNVNVTDEIALSAFFDEVEALWGGIDIVHANAGIGGPADRIVDLGFDAWRSTLDVNLNGTFLTAKCAARIFEAQKSGLLVMMSSSAGLFGYPYRAAYATAKWGIIGLMKTLAMELGPMGIRVNAICPGAVEGDRMDRVVANEAKSRNVSQEEVRASYVKTTSLRTWVTADDIADMVEFLAGPAGQKISGQALSVDGHTEAIM